MSISLEAWSCSGYEACGTLVIHYRFPGGIQGPRMLRPGAHYSGTSRTTYLPNNGDGREACALLEEAFQMGMIFIVGDSVTSGKQNTVIWSGIHHKTCTWGGAEWHGWPDPGYFSRLQHECAAHGVFAAAVRKSMEASEAK